MKKHLSNCFKYKKYVLDETGDNPDMIHNFFEANNPRRRSVMTNDDLKEKVLRIIIAGNLSFSHAENPEFVETLKDAYPDCILPSRKTIVELLKTKAEMAKQDLVTKLSHADCKVSLAVDCWTTRNNVAFLGTFQFCNGNTFILIVDH